MRRVSRWLLQGGIKFLAMWLKPEEVLLKNALKLWMMERSNAPWKAGIAIGLSEDSQTIVLNIMVTTSGLQGFLL